MIQTDLQGPVITKIQRSLSGVDNAGIGHTKFGERFLMKLEPAVCLAEFIGASLCRRAGIPVCEPCVVNFKGRPVFGSRLEAGMREVKDSADLSDVVAKCINPDVFSAMLAIDLAVGNNDRHWGNWLYQEVAGVPGGVVVRGLDFSRAWPSTHPPVDAESMRGANTHEAWALWSVFGIAFSLASAQHVCATLSSLPDEWIHNLCSDLPDEWKHHPDVTQLCEWWSHEWRNRVASTLAFIEKGAWT